MTWKKTKIHKQLRRGTRPLWDILLHRPYNEKNYRANGLPPGWQRMCKAVGLRPEGHRASRGKSWQHLIGGGRHWRVNVNNELDVSCRHEKFDRWAISTVATFTIPKTYTELLLRTKFTTYDT